MSSVRATINHENVWPTKVLTLSTNSNSFCMAGSPLQMWRQVAPLSCHSPLGCWQRGKKTPSGRRMVSFVSYRGPTSGLLRGGGRLLAEVIVVRHAPTDIGVKVPPHRAFGERLLRLDDL